MNWEKYDHFTGKPYKKQRNGSWNIIDYICGDVKIAMMPNGDWELTKENKKLGQFKTLKAAKAQAETI